VGCAVRAMCSADQIRTVAKERLGARRGEINETTMRRIADDSASCSIFSHGTPEYLRRSGDLYHRPHGAEAGAALPIRFSGSGVACVEVDRARIECDLRGPILPVLTPNLPVVTPSAATIFACVTNGGQNVAHWS